MNKLLQSVGLVVVGLVILTVATPALTKLTHALIPFVVTVGVITALLRAIWFFTR